jgi:hypothetical protein
MPSTALCIVVLQLRGNWPLEVNARVIVAVLYGDGDAPRLINMGNLPRKIP